MTRNSSSNTDGSNPDGTSAAGNPGEPKGSRHGATQAIQRLIDDQSEATTKKAVEMALEDDTVSRRL